VSLKIHFQNVQRTIFLAMFSSVNVDGRVRVSGTMGVDRGPQLLGTPPRCHCRSSRRAGAIGTSRPWSRRHADFGDGRRLVVGCNGDRIHENAPSEHVVGIGASLVSPPISPMTTSWRSGLGSQPWGSERRVGFVRHLSAASGGRRNPRSPASIRGTAAASRVSSGRRVWALRPRRRGRRGAPPLSRL
jgi:hypothetical protein